jgi:hypothetical protein
MKKFVQKVTYQVRNFTKTNNKYLGLNEIPLTTFFPATPDRITEDFPTEIKYETTVLENGVTLKSSVL